MDAIHNKKKLKSPNLLPEVIIGLLIGIPFLAVLIITKDISLGYRVVFPAFLIGCLLGPWLFIRTGNRSYLVHFLFFLSLTALVYVLGFRGTDDNRGILIALVIITVISIVWLYVLIFQRKLKFRTREILELAAMQVDENERSYTSRPMPVGIAIYSKEELHSFSRFIRSNLIAIPFYEEDRIIFSLDTSYANIYGIKKDYSSRTWVSFDYQGNVTVNFALRDYLYYKEDLTFDQLCLSLGKLFIEFLELCKEGKEIRIIDKLNSLKLNPMT